MLPALRNASPDDRPADIAWGSVKVNADAKTRSVNPQICSTTNQIMDWKVARGVAGTCCSQ